MKEHSPMLKFIANHMNECQKKRAFSGTLNALVGQVCVDVEELRKALQPIAEAQTMLEDNYPRWNEAGKKHAIESASKALRDAHSRISCIYAQAIGLPNVTDDLRERSKSNGNT